MVIAIGPLALDKIAAILKGEDDPAFTRTNVTPWLRQSSSRLWTLPVLLLCPGEHRINCTLLENLQSLRHWQSGTLPREHGMMLQLSKNWLIILRAPP